MAGVGLGGLKVLGDRPVEDVFAGIYGGALSCPADQLVEKFGLSNQLGVMRLVLTGNQGVSGIRSVSDHFVEHEE